RDHDHQLDWIGLLGVVARAAPRRRVAAADGVRDGRPGAPALLAAHRHGGPLHLERLARPERLRCARGGARRMKLDPQTFRRLGVWASLGLALHVGMVSWAKAAQTDVVPRWAVAQCVTLPPGVACSAEQLADTLAQHGLLVASPVGYQIRRGRV